MRVPKTLSHLVSIDPDIVVEPAKIEKLDVGQVLHEADLKGALPNPDTPGTTGSTKPPTPATPTPGNPDKGAEKPPEQGTTDADVMGGPQDYQLARAIDLLRGVEMFGNRTAQH